VSECPFCGAPSVSDGVCGACQTAVPAGVDLSERYRVNLRHGKGRDGHARPVAHSGLMQTKSGRWRSNDGTVPPLTNTDPEAVS
jgi:hypothetical protein